MIQLRLVVPPDLSRTVLARLHATPSVYAISHFPGVSARPDGDLVECYVASEDASMVVAELQGLGLPERGVIAIDRVETVLSAAARHAEQMTSGSLDRRRRATHRLPNDRLLPSGESASRGC